MAIALQHRPHLHRTARSASTRPHKPAHNVKKPTPNDPNLPTPDVDGTVKLISTPSTNGHPDFVASIEGAQTSVFMEMFHLTDMAVVDALIKAHTNGKDVKVILDRATIENDKKINSTEFLGPFQKLQNAGVNVRESSAGFSIQHVKSMVVDGHTSFITSINLTKEYQTTRDFGLILEDQKIATEMLSVFNSDWGNCLTGKTDTPELTDPNLVWSPNDSEDRLTKLVQRAKHTVIATVENLGDPSIQNAMMAAAGKGLSVRLIVPEVNKGTNANYPALKTLLAGGVNARVMPYPPSVATPYMHSKMILIDDTEVYIGSVNFSKNSTEKARELGIILPRSDVVTSIASTFETDWAVSITPPASQPVEPTKPTAAFEREPLDMIM